MALKDLLAKIEAEAQEQADAILKQGAQAVEMLKQSADSETQKEVGAIRQQGKRLAESERSRVLSLANLEVRKRLLTTRQQAIGEVIDKAIKKLRDLPAQEYFELLQSKIHASPIQGQTELLLNPKDRQRVPQDFVDRVNRSLSNGSIVLSDETRDIDGGFVLRTGRTEENCSFKAVLQQMRDALELEVGRALFGESEQ